MAHFVYGLKRLNKQSLNLTEFIGSNMAFACFVLINLLLNVYSQTVGIWKMIIMLTVKRLINILQRSTSPKAYCFFQTDQLTTLEKIMMDASGKSYHSSSSVPDFMYGTSPGFLSWRKELLHNEF